MTLSILVLGSLQASAAQFLNAECAVSACRVAGGEDASLPGAITTESVCGNPEGFGLDWNHAAVQIFQYAGTDDSQKHKGFVAITPLLKAPVQRRLGNYGLEPVNVMESKTAMTMTPADPHQSYRRFTIGYSTATQPESTGYVEVEFLAPWRTYTVLELNHCHTLTAEGGYPDSKPTKN